jgi:hypothetical protein
MNIIRNSKTLLLVLGIAALLPLSARAAELSDVEVQTFSMTIHGGSTLHDWESQATQLTVDGAPGITDGMLAGNKETRRSHSVYLYMQKHGMTPFCSPHA